MRLSFVCVILFLVNTCGNSHPVNLNQEFLLKFGEAATLKSEQMVIRFASLNQDSRCPKEVQCITAGEAQITLEVGKAKERLDRIQLSTEPDSTEVRYDKFKIKLLEVMPYPKASETKEPGRYSVRLIISDV